MKQRLKQIILDTLQIDLTIDHFADTMPLLEDGLGLDSLKVVQVVVTLEQEFSIFFEDEDLTRDRFANVLALEQCIQNKLTANSQNGTCDSRSTEAP